MPDVGGVGELRQRLPQRGGEETVGHSAVALHAGKYHPAESDGPANASQGVVERIG